MVEITDFFRLSPSTHLAWFAIFGITLAFLRCTVATFNVSDDFLIFFGSGSSGVIKLAPLCAANWVTHVVIFQFSLELAAGMHALMKQSKHEYKGFFSAYALAAVYSLVILLSHGMIGVNESIELLLFRWFVVLLQTFAFGAGLSSAIGPWSMISIFVAASLDLIGFDGQGKWSGRLLATFTAYMHFKKFHITFATFANFTSVIEYITFKMFAKFASSVLGWSPEMANSQWKTDTGHLFIGFFFMLNMGAMVFTLNREVKARNGATKMKAKLMVNQAK